MSFRVAKECQKGNLGAPKVAQRHQKNVPSSPPRPLKTPHGTPLGTLLGLLGHQNSNIGSILEKKASQNGPEQENSETLKNFVFQWSFMVFQDSVGIVFRAFWNKSVPREIWKGFFMKKYDCIAWRQNCIAKVAPEGPRRAQRRPKMPPKGT